MKLVITIVYMAACLAGFTQTVPTIQTQKSLGGSDYDAATSIQQTADGGYIVAGVSYSNDGDVSGNHGPGDYWLVKLKKDGMIQWQKSLGGSLGDIAYSVQQTADRGYIVAGASTSTDGDVSGHHGGYDYWVVKLEENGSIQWQKSLGGSNDDVGSSIQQTVDSGYIVAGDSGSYNEDVSGQHGALDYWLVKLKRSGAIQWQKCFGGSNVEHAYSVQQTADSGYIVAGVSYSNDSDVSGNHGSGDYWMVKLKKSGALEWQKCLGGSNFDYAFSVQQTADGGYIVAGYSSSNDGDVSGHHGSDSYTDCWIVKLKMNGTIQWQKSLGGSGNDAAKCIQQTRDGGYIVAGYSYSNDGDVSGNHGLGDYWVVKLKKTGAIQWQKSLGGSYDDLANSIQQTSDSGYILTGRSNSNNGDVSGNHGADDYWVVKLRKDGSFLQGFSKHFPAHSQNEDATLEKLQDFIVYPNPAKDILYLGTKGRAVFSLINSYGEILVTKTISGNGSMDISALPPGSYYVKNNATGEVHNLIVEK